MNSMYFFLLALHTYGRTNLTKTLEDGGILPGQYYYAFRINDAIKNVIYADVELSCVRPNYQANYQILVEIRLCLDTNNPPDTSTVLEWVIVVIIE